jgi:hypothetical protein
MRVFDSISLSPRVIIAFILLFLAVVLALAVNKEKSQTTTVPTSAQRDIFDIIADTLANREEEVFSKIERELNSTS